MTTPATTEDNSVPQTQDKLNEEREGQGEKKKKKKKLAVKRKQEQQHSRVSSLLAFVMKGCLSRALSFCGAVLSF